MANYDLKKISRPSQPRSKKLRGLYSRSATVSVLASQTTTKNNLTSGSGTTTTSSNDKLSKITDDTAQGRITLAGGAYADDISSASFVSGFAGEGWRLSKDENGKYNLEIDDMTVRGVFSVYELLIQKIRATGGSIVVSAANGKVTSVDEYSIGLDEYYQLNFDGPHEFEANDIIKCQVFTGSGVKSYQGIVSTTGASFIVLPKTDFVGDPPSAGDEIVQFGNTANTARQGLVYITAIDGGQPRVDIYDGIDSGILVGKLKGRYGDLSGIVDSRFPDIGGYGIYSQNAYLTGDMNVRTGSFEELGRLTTDGSSDPCFDFFDEEFIRSQKDILGLANEGTELPIRMEMSVLNATRGAGFEAKNMLEVIGTYGYYYPYGRSYYEATAEPTTRQYISFSSFSEDGETWYVLPLSDARTINGAYRKTVFDMICFTSQTMRYYAFGAAAVGKAVTLVSCADNTSQRIARQSGTVTIQGGEVVTMTYLLPLLNGPTPTPTDRGAGWLLTSRIDNNW